MTTGGVALVRCVTDGAKLVSIPVCWTSLRRIDDFERVSRGRSVLRADDLAELRGIVDSHLESLAGDDQ